MADGLFVAIEGIDRSGKTTLTARLAATARHLGYTTTQISEPSTTPIGAVFRQLSGDAGLSPTTAALLSAADRHNQQPNIARDLAAADLLVADRYYLSGLAYHSADGILPSFYRSLNDGIRRPDLYLYLVVDLPTAQRRRGSHDDRWEAPELAARVPAAYEACLREIQLLDQVPVARIDAAKTPTAVHDDALSAIVSALTERQAA